MSRAAFVTGVTGTQGRAVALQLVAQGWKSHAVIRQGHVGTEAASELERAGVKLFPGDWDDEPALSAALAGCSAAFVALTPDYRDLSSEVAYTRRIARLAREAGTVKTVVLSTGVMVTQVDAYADLDQNGLTVQVIRSKLASEEVIRTAGFDSYTILRPAFFMANFLSPKVQMMADGLLSTGEWRQALSPQTQMAMVDERDIARFAVAAMEDPACFGGHEISLASQYKTPDELMSDLSRAISHPLKAVYMTDDEIQAEIAVNPLLIQSSLVIRRLGKFIDLDKVRSYGVPMGTFEDYLVREKDDIKKTFG